MICRSEKPISRSGTAMAAGGGDVDSLLLGSDKAAEDNSHPEMLCSLYLVEVGH